MNSQPVLIFSDLDGTLLDHYSYQAYAAMDTLKRLQAATIPVILNTSKTVAEVNVIQQQLQLLSPFIVENGAAIYIPIGTFAQQPKETIEKEGYWIKSFCSPRTYWLDFLTTHASEFSSLYQGFSSLSATAISELTGLTNDEAERAKLRQYGEPINWLGDDSAKNAFIEHLIDMGANVVHGGRFIHVGGYCDKGQAMIWLAEQYRNNLNSSSILTIALGDGENDISMLESADIAVQVRSPVHSYPVLTRQPKTIQTDRYGPEGWADSIETLLSKQFRSISNNSEVHHG